MKAGLKVGLYRMSAKWSVTMGDRGGRKAKQKNQQQHEQVRSQEKKEQADKQQPDKPQPKVKIPTDRHDAS